MENSELEKNVKDLLLKWNKEIVLMDVLGVNRMENLFYVLL